MNEASSAGCLVMAGLVPAIHVLLDLRYGSICLFHD
jgi:hypothetical protein